jgi:TonB family protein
MIRAYLNDFSSMMNRPTFRRYMGAALLLPLAAGVTGCETEEPVQETPPAQISPSTFQYPEELWDAGEEGETTLRIFITATGAVDSAQVEESSGHEAFDSAAVEGAHRLRFEPPMRGDEPTAGWFLLPVQFEMDAAQAGGATGPVTEEGEEPAGEEDGA